MQQMQPNATFQCCGQPREQKSQSALPELPALSLDAFGHRLSERIGAVVRQTILELQVENANIVVGEESQYDATEQPVIPATGCSWDSKPDVAGTATPREACRETSGESRAEVRDSEDPSSAVRIGDSSTVSLEQVSVEEPLDFGEVRSTTLARVKTLVNVKHDDGAVFNIALKGADQSSNHLTGEAIRAAEAVDLHRKFLELDTDNIGLVSVDSLSTKEDFAEFSSKLSQLKEAVGLLNSHLGDLHSGAPDEISLETFKVIMLAELSDLESIIGSDEARLVVALREVVVRDSLADKVEEICNVVMEEVLGKQSSRYSWVDVYFEPMVAAMILFNAVTIGVSLDNAQDSKVWSVLEYVFGIFFTLELLIKVKAHGIVGHFLGADWGWNWFDFALVVCAMADLIISSFATDIDMRHLTVVRLVRLVRIARLIRLLHLKMFEELQLMVLGIAGGLKTLMWAILFLVILVYALGVILRQIMVSYEDSISGCLGATPNPKCNRGAIEVQQYGHYMWGSVPRAMLTVFTCFTDGCSSASGTPMLWHVWDTAGPVMVLGYVGFFFFVTFGIFNLILAIFVERTLQYAKVSDQKRHMKAHSEHIHNARKLQQLLVKVCSSEAVLSSSPSRLSSLSQDAPKGLLKYYDDYKAWRNNKEPEPVDPRHLNMRVKKENFEHAIGDEEVQDILEDLGISPASMEHLFDILDSDGNGFLAVSEVADGIMRLRGPADKGDTVQAVVMVRAVQKHMVRFEEAVLNNQNTLHQLMAELASEGLVTKMDSFNPGEDARRSFRM